MKTPAIISGMISLIMILSIGTITAQEAKKIYDPALDGMKQINDAITAAKKGNRHILIQYGGNWCPWCLRFDAFSKADAEISKLIADNYIPVKINYSPENYNYEVNVFLGNPVRFGFPVFIIVDGKGKVLHIQDSALLEEGEGYSQKKVAGFLKNWTLLAIVPKNPKGQVKK